jgi:hypothetical protein
MSSIALKEVVVEEHLLYTATKAAPLKIKNNTFCSSSQVEYKDKQFTLTNRHCCQVIARRGNSKRARDASFKRFDLAGQYINVGSTPRQILELDTKHDLCVLEPDLSKPALKLASGYDVGDRITVIGHPRGMPQTIRKGRVIAKEVSTFYWVNPIIPVAWTFVTNTGYGGNSGSPVGVSHRDGCSSFRSS